MYLLHSIIWLLILISNIHDGLPALWWDFQSCFFRMDNLCLLAITLNYTIGCLGLVLIESSWSILPSVTSTDYSSILYHFHFLCYSWLFLRGELWFRTFHNFLFLQQLRTWVKILHCISLQEWLEVNLDNYSIDWLIYPKGSDIIAP